MSRRVAAATIVGREVELATIDALLTRTAGGEPSTLLITGDAGVGKTRLVDELASRARAGGFLVLVGGCLDLGEGGVPMAPIAEAVRRLRDQLTKGLRHRNELHLHQFLYGFFVGHCVSVSFRS